MRTNILIVEDSPTQAVQLEEALRVRGYETRTAANGSEALEIVRRRRPALILSDVMMPVMDGFQLCRAIKQDPALCRIPVILLTSLSSPADVLSALEAGADFHIPKPYQAAYLLRKIDAILASGSENAREEPGTTETVTLDGTAYRISASREHVLRLLLSTYEVAIQQNREVLLAREELRSQNVTLEKTVCERTASLMGEVVDRKRAEWALRERMKERTCLYAVSRSLQEDLTVDELCRRTVESLVPAMQFPDITVPVIELKGNRYTSGNYIDGLSHSLHSEIRLEGEAVGHLSVSYMEERPFLIPEEQDLVNGVAEALSTWLERRRADMALWEAKEHLEIRVRERTAEVEQVNRTLQVEIAERKSAEKAANLERQRLYDVLETLPAYVVLLSADYHVPFANRVFRERFGESGGRRCYEYLFNRATPCENCETFTVLKTAAPHHWEWIGPDGLNYDIFDFPFTDTDGAPLILEMGIDITARKWAQAALTEVNESLERRVAERTTELRLSETRLSDIVFSMGDWVWEVDENGVYTYSSPKGVELLGDVIGKTPFDFMPPDEAERVAATFSEIAARKAPIRDLENWNIGKNGERICLLTNGVPILDEAGNLKGYRGVDKDITDQRQLEAQFLQAQKMETVGRLAGGIAHDFNNLLTVINGTAELAAMDLRDDDPLRTEFQEIRQAGDRAAALTRQLLAFSRKQVMKPEVLNLSALVANLQSMLPRLIGEHITLVVRPGQDLGSVMADPVQIEQVVMNLAVNARDAMPNGGTLIIETRDVALDAAYAAAHPSVQPGPHVMLAISDTGVGMDEATRARIFEPFFTTKDPGKGTGLGLSTVYGIIKQSNGSIWVYSEPGKGTTFKIYLPRVEAIAPLGQPAPTATSGTGTETILIVEDDEAVQHLARRVLQSAGYTVVAAGSGREALAALERHEGPVHLVLTDMIMPGMSGRDLVARLEDTRPHMKVIYTSGYTDEAILHHGLLDKAADFIGKPYTAAELTRKVRDVLDTPDRRPARG